MAPKSKAAAAATQIKKGAGKMGTKVHTKVHFYKPKTLKLDRKPAYPSKAVPRMSKFDKYRVIKYPLTTEVRFGLASQLCLVVPIPLVGATSSS
jgi:large subunit ribosomal protein L23Ae